MLLVQTVSAFDHEAHDLIRRIDNTEAIGLLLVVDLVEFLIDDLEKVLLFMVAGDESSGTLDRGA